MRKLLVPILLISIYCYSVISFEKTFGKEWNDNANSVIQTSDGGYLFTGCQVDSVDYKVSFFVVTKIDSLGEKEWEKTYTGGMTSSTLNNAGYSVIETTDGSYVAAGCIEELNHLIHTVPYVIKLDPSGNKLWDYRFGSDGSVNISCSQIIQTYEGGYALTGDDFGIGLLLKLDNEGEKVWTNDSSYLLDHINALVQTEDNGYALTGQGGLNDELCIYLVKTDSLGNLQWTEFFPGLFYSADSYSLKITPDNGFIIIGKTQQNASTDLGWLIKTDENGEKQWDILIGEQGSETESTVGRSLDLTSDGGYILAGYTENRSTGLSDSWLIKTDSEGNELWTQTYGGEGDDRIYSVQQTTDGGYVLAGYTDSSGAGGKDMWIIKTDENGTEIESPFIPQSTELFQNYPNPFNPVTTISYALSQAGQAELSVFNLNGQLVSSLVNGKQEKGSHKVEFDAGDLTSGLYIYTLKVDGKAVQSRKMMLLK
ncbi:MAG: T9SS type A sorting domain-containing protein [Candidatus Delongbacteria bacterium]|nr:T9SS type A sorting domain-containing protein [Candidatus Delongbacteria bacterium]MDD4206090.1 T9SS type A sorting domain-containing protein [Candidatus Delongbacteria bacterium]